jgi:hypothetical protein
MSKRIWIELSGHNWSNFVHKMYVHFGIAFKSIQALIYITVLKKSFYCVIRCIHFSKGYHTADVTLPIFEKLKKLKFNFRFEK